MDFLDFTAWGKQAENLAKYVKKGNRLAVQAKARRDSWEDKETKERRNRISFNVTNFEFIESNANGNGNTTTESGHDTPTTPATSTTVPPFDTNDNDLEF